jgi:hypothetical protein
MAVIFTPGTFLRVPEEVCARNVRVDADFSTAQTAEELLRPGRAGTTQRTGFLVVDPVNFETLMKVCPMIRFVGIRHSLSAIRTQMKAKAWLSQLNTGWNRVPAALATDHGRVAILIVGKSRRGVPPGRLCLGGSRAFKSAPMVDLAAQHTVKGEP